MPAAAAPRPAFPGVLLAAILAAVPAAGDGQPPAPDPEIWVTMDAGELDVLRRESPAEAAGRLPVAIESHRGVALAVTRESRLEDLASAVHARYHRCAGFIAYTTREEATRALYAPPARAAAPPEGYTIDNAPTVNAIVGEVDAAQIVATITQLQSYWTRYYTTQTGYDAAVWLKSHWEQIAAGRSDISVRFFDHPGWLQHSVIVRIQGAQMGGEAVVLGAHLDSVRSGQATTGRAPGADDDASGIASLTEMLRAAVAAGYRPARTVMIMGYAGEEAGLRGSRDIATAMNATNPYRERLTVVGALQLDMTNYRSTASNAVDVGILSDPGHTNAAQNAFVRDLVTAYLPSLTVDAATQCGYGCSDHSAWTIEGGVPASIPFESRFGQHNPTLHTQNDTLANSDPTGGHAAKFSKIAAAYMAELAKGSVSTGDATR